MYDYQQAVLKMILEILNFFEENKDLLNSNTVLKKHYEQLKTLADELKKNIAIQSADTTGFSREKLRIKQELSELTTMLTAPIRSYATDNKNEALFDAFKISVSVLNNSKDVEVENYSGTVVSKLAELKESLKEYNVSEEDINNLQAKLDEFSKQLLKPAQVRKDKAIATTNIKKLITKILSLLRDSIDNDMVSYAKSQPALYDQYLKLREIDDSQTTHLSLYGNVSDEETKQALRNVAVTIIRSKIAGNLEDIVKMTTDKGYYQFKKLEPGKYTIRFELEHYDTAEIEIVTYKNQSKKLDIGLRKSENFIEKNIEEEKKDNEENAEENNEDNS